MEDVAKNFLVIKMLEGMRRLNKTNDSRLPITPILLEKILFMLPAVCFNRYEALLFQAAYSLAFFAFLRVGEICLSVGNVKDSILQLNDVSFHPDKSKLFLEFRRSKTDQTANGVTMCINEIGGRVCPIKCLREYLHVRSKGKGPLFCHVGGEPLTRSQFSSVLDKALKACKFRATTNLTHFG